MANPFADTFTSSASKAVSPTNGNNPFADTFGAAPKSAVAASAPAKSPVAGFGDVAASAQPGSTSPLAAPLATKVQSGALPQEDASKLLNLANGVTLAPSATTAKDTSNLPSIGDKAEQYFPSTMQTLSDLQIDPLSLKADPKKVISDYWDGIKNSAVAAWNDHINQQQDNAAGASVSQKIGDTGKSIAGAASFALSPITSLFSAANDVPILGTVSKLISLPFEASGEGASDVSTKIVNELPISAQAKKNLIPGISQISALAAQFAAGGGYEETAIGLGLRPTELDTLIKSSGMVDGKTLAQKFGDTDAQTILDQAKTKSDEIVKNPQVTEAQKPTLESLATEEPKNNKTATTNSPTVDLSGKGTVSDVKSPDVRTPLDAIRDKINNASPKTNDIIAPETPVKVEGKGNFKVLTDEGRPTVKVVDKDTGNETEVPRENVSTSNKAPIDEIVKTRTVNKLRSIEGTGEEKVAGLSKSVEAQFMQSGLTGEMEDLPTSKKVVMADQDKNVMDLVVKDPERAMRIAMMEENAPKDIIPERVYTLLRLKAHAEGDGESAQQLAQSPLAEQATTMGRKINALKGANNEDPTQAIKDLQDAREKGLKEKFDSEVKKASESIKKATADRVSGKTKINLSEFIKNLQC